jgi:hypothetical protein
MCSIALPIVVSFEGAVLVAIHDRRKARRDAVRRADEAIEAIVPSHVDPIPGALSAHDPATADIRCSA